VPLALADRSHGRSELVEQFSQRPYLAGLPVSHEQGESVQAHFLEAPHFGLPCWRKSH
jgi:hypothetical protein